MTPRAPEPAPGPGGQRIGNRVWKYILDYSTDTHDVEMPLFSRTLYTTMEAPGRIAVWCEVNTCLQSPDGYRRRFYIVGTGHEIPTSPAPFNGEPQYVGTAIDDGLVWHIYDAGMAHSE